MGLIGEKTTKKNTKKEGKKKKEKKIFVEKNNKCYI